MGGAVWGVEWTRLRCVGDKWSRTEPPTGPERPVRGGACGKEGSEAGHTPPRHYPAGWNPGPPTQGVGAAVDGVPALPVLAKGLLCAI